MAVAECWSVPRPDAEVRQLLVRAARSGPKALGKPVSENTVSRRKFLPGYGVNPRNQRQLGLRAERWEAIGGERVVRRMTHSIRPAAVASLLLECGGPLPLRLAALLCRFGFQKAAAGRRTRQVRAPLSARVVRLAFRRSAPRRSPGRNRSARQPMPPAVRRRVTRRDPLVGPPKGGVSSFRRGCFSPSLMHRRWVWGGPEAGSRYHCSAVAAAEVRSRRAAGSRPLRASGRSGG